MIVLDRDPSTASTGTGRIILEQLERLKSAVEALYVAAYWKPDRPLENERELWTNLRDAAGIEEGTKTGFVFQGLTEEEREERR